MKKSQIKGLRRARGLGVLVLALAIGLMAAPGAKAASIDLLTAGPFNYALLGLGTTVTLTSSAVSSLFPGFANVGVNPPGLLTATGSVSIAGNVILDNLGQDNFNDSIVGGAVILDGAALAQAKADAIARSAFYAGLAATQPLITTINTNSTIIGTGGLNVINLTGGLALTGTETLTLQGTAADAFVINVPNNAAFSMLGTSQILVAGGLLEQNVLFNLLEDNAPYTVAGAEIDGLILAPNVLFIATGTIIGEIIASDVQLHSSAQLIDPVVPVPPSVLLFGSGLLGLGLVGGRKWFRKS
jgi:hypothetical protein